MSYQHLGTCPQIYQPLGRRGEGREWWSCPGRGGGRGAGVMSGFGTGASPRVIPKDGESPEPVFVSQANLTHMHSLSWEQHVCTQVRMKKSPSTEDEGEVDVIPCSSDSSTPPLLSPWLFTPGWSPHQVHPLHTSGGMH